MDVEADPDEERTLKVLGPSKDRGGNGPEAPVSILENDPDVDLRVVS